MKIDLDEIDRKILHYVCSGIHSYTELGKLCRVGRNTIYRRVDRLEKMGAIKKLVMAVPDYDKLNLAAVNIGLNVRQIETDKAVEILKRLPRVKFLWKTYGTHSITMVVFCEKDKIGEDIFNLKISLEKEGIDAHHMDVSTSFSWEKMDFSPYVPLKGLGA
ncbi:MAG: Lrp/AsnC family transcriptional regulator [Candidatus Bathyarchaeia archaeon]